MFEYRHHCCSGFHSPLANYEKVLQAALEFLLFLMLFCTLLLNAAIQLKLSFFGDRPSSLVEPERIQILL